MLMVEIGKSTSTGLQTESKVRTNMVPIHYLEDLVLRLVSTIKIA